MNAIIMMISQGAMILGGLTWGAMATIAGPSYTLFTAAALFTVSLLLNARLSINVSKSANECAFSLVPANLKSQEVASGAFTPGFSPA
jgi:hypothetical protein